jgi:hypothetical protein
MLPKSSDIIHYQTTGDEATKGELTILVKWIL